MNTSITQPTPRLKLFSVMIPWHSAQSELGTYEDSVWAETPDEAELAIAGMMADSGDSGCETDAEREAFAKQLVDNGLSVILAVEDTIQSDLRRLLSGPDDNFGPNEKQAFEKILSMLKIPVPN
ncbi:hypothetical protein LMG26857_03444 [Achromobacter anxifer]|uniref:hypothetical protein n=1 Tax=Achromobacter anxifer TaxID=1287737 RepID=UPI00155D00EC|nr:hypothetical protein [Achromobacter anxifer]CAB5514385.1 hypothetical protein LMG26857_03444 [Achromobacter anxifer]